MPRAGSITRTAALLTLGSLVAMTACSPPSDRDRRAIGSGKLEKVAYTPVPPGIRQMKADMKAQKDAAQPSAPEPELPRDPYMFDPARAPVAEASFEGEARETMTLTVTRPRFLNLDRATVTGKGRTYSPSKLASAYAGFLENNLSVCEGSDCAEVTAVAQDMVGTDGEEAAAESLGNDPFVISSRIRHTQPKDGECTISPSASQAGRVNYLSPRLSMTFTVSLEDVPESPTVQVPFPGGTSEFMGVEAGMAVVDGESGEGEVVCRGVWSGANRPRELEMATVAELVEPEAGMAAAEKVEPEVEEKAEEAEDEEDAEAEVAEAEAEGPEEAEAEEAAAKAEAEEDAETVAEAEGTEEAEAEEAAKAEAAEAEAGEEAEVAEKAEATEETEAEATEPEAKKAEAEEAEAEETEAEAAEAETEAAKAETEVAEAEATEAEAPEAETEAAEAETEVAKAETEEAEAEATEAEAPEAETEAAEAETEVAKAETEEAEAEETEAEEAEVAKAETEAEKAETEAEKAETEAEEAETQAKKAETEAEKAETEAEKAEAEKEEAEEIAEGKTTEETEAAAEAEEVAEGEATEETEAAAEAEAAALKAPAECPADPVPFSGKHLPSYRFVSMAKGGREVTFSITRPRVFNIDYAAVAKSDGYDALSDGGLRGVMDELATFFTKDDNLRFRDANGIFVGVKRVSVAKVEAGPGADTSGGCLKEVIMSGSVGDDSGACVTVAQTSAVSYPAAQFFAPNVTVTFVATVEYPLSARPSHVALTFPGLFAPEGGFAGEPLGISVVTGKDARKTRKKNICSGSDLSASVRAILEGGR